GEGGVDGAAGNAGALVGRFSTRVATAGRRVVRVLSRLNQNGAPSVSSAALSASPNKWLNHQNFSVRQRANQPPGTSSNPVLSMFAFKSANAFSLAPAST